MSNSKVVDYIVERFQANNSGCCIKLGKDNPRFLEHFDGERVNDIKLEPEELRNIEVILYGSEKNNTKR